MMGVCNEVVRITSGEQVLQDLRMSSYGVAGALESGVVHTLQAEWTRMCRCYDESMPSIVFRGVAFLTRRIRHALIAI